MIEARQPRADIDGNELAEDRGGQNDRQPAHVPEAEPQKIGSQPGEGEEDRQEEDQHELHFLQGDTRHAGSPADGAIARSQIADVLVAALTSDAANGKTLELVAEHGPAQADLDPLFAALAADVELDGAKDADNMPVASEPVDVVADLERVRALRN